MELAENTIRELARRGLTLTTAESCTGGLLSSCITAVSGASAVFDMGFITYSNEAKIQLLGVHSDVLAEYGAVSKQTAEQMANGASEHAAADIAVAITGIAGPNSDGTGKPVGLVYIAVCCDKGCFVVENKFGENKSRGEIRERTVNKALQLVYDCVTDFDEFMRSESFVNIE